MADVPPATQRFAAHVGAEAVERPAPALARALGGFAALVAAAALVALGLDIVLDGGSRAGAATLFLLYAGGGFALVVFGGPSRRTAGVTAMAVAVPAVPGFLILERGGYSASEPAAVLAVSTVAWAVLYVAGPTRGHGILLGAALAGAWATVMVGLDALAVFDPTVFDSRPMQPAVVSLLFGAAYVAAGFGLDRAGLAGTATGFLGVGIAALGAGVALAAVDGSEVAVGLLLLGSGAAAGLIGERLGRRFTTWVGAGAIAAGLAALSTAPFDGDDVAPPALAVLALSAVAVLLVPRLARFPGEPGEPGEPDKPRERP